MTIFLLTGMNTLPYLQKKVKLLFFIMVKLFFIHGFGLHLGAVNIIGQSWPCGSGNQKNSQ